MQEKLKSWGDWQGVLDGSIPYSLDHDCRNCNWSTFDRYVDSTHWQEHVIGFTTDCRPSANVTRIGAVIVECPKCFSKFWFHVNDEMVECCKKWCPKWPGYQPEKEEDQE